MSSLPRQFIFNGDNKEVEVKKDGVTIGRYFYDGEGKRVKKITDTETTIFVYSAGKLIAEYSTQLSQKPSVAYLTNDHLGSPRVITDEFGPVRSRRDFMPFGEELYTGVGGRNETLKYGSGEDNVRQKFTGYQKDTETDLDFAEARMYETKHGRFTAVDPLLASGNSANPQTFNRYIYVTNNPLAYVDPTSLDGCQAFGTCNSPGPASERERISIGPRDSDLPVQDGNTLIHEAAHAAAGPPASAVFVPGSVFQSEQVRGGDLIPEGVPTDQKVTDTYTERRWSIHLDMQLVDGSTGAPLNDYEYEVSYDNAGPVETPVEGRQSPLDGNSFIGTFRVHQTGNPDPSVGIPEDKTVTASGTVTIYGPGGNTARTRFEITVKGYNVTDLTPPSPVNWMRPRN